MKRDLKEAVLDAEMGKVRQREERGRRVDTEDHPTSRHGSRVIE